VAHRQTSLLQDLASQVLRGHIPSVTGNKRALALVRCPGSCKEQRGCSPQAHPAATKDRLNRLAKLALRWLQSKPAGAGPAVHAAPAPAVTEPRRTWCGCLQHCDDLRPATLQHSQPPNCWCQVDCPTMRPMNPNSKPQTTRALRLWRGDSGVAPAPPAVARAEGTGGDWGIKRS